MTLDQWMTANGLTDAALSKKLGEKVSRSQISRIRTGTSRPSPGVARLLATVTGIDAGALALGQPKIPPRRRRAALAEASA